MTIENSHNLSAAIKNRNMILEEINDLKYRLQDQEYKIKKELVQTGMVEFLTINWRLLNRNLL